MNNKSLAKWTWDGQESVNVRYTKDGTTWISVADVVKMFGRELDGPEGLAEAPVREVYEPTDEELLWFARAYMRVGNAVGLAETARLISCLGAHVSAPELAEALREDGYLSAEAETWCNPTPKASALEVLSLKLGVKPALMVTPLGQAYFANLYREGVES